MLELWSQHGVQLIDRQAMHVIARHCTSFMGAGHHPTPTVAGSLNIRSGSDLDVLWLASGWSVLALVGYARNG